MTAFALKLTPGTLAANQDTVEPTIDEQIVAMALLSIPRRKIMDLPLQNRTPAPR